MSPATTTSSSSHIVSVPLLLTVLLATLIASLEASPSRVDEDLFLRNLLLRQYLPQQPQVSEIVAVPMGQDQDETAAEDLQQQQFVPLVWRQRRTVDRPKKMFRLASDQYTPTPCRWKLCASIFKGSF